MPLSAEIISENYQQTLALTEKLLRRDMRGRGYDAADNEAFQDICYSVAGDEHIVRLIQTEPFSAARYEPAISTAISEVKRQLFPDTRKKRFVSIDSLTAEPEWLAVSPEIDIQESAPDKILPAIEVLLSAEDRAYLQAALRLPAGDWQHLLVYWWQCSRNNDTATLAAEISRRIRLLGKHFPDGAFIDFTQLNSREALPEHQIRRVFLQYYLGMERTLPPNFLQTETDFRAAVMVRCLVSEVLNSTPEQILSQKDETFFIRHKLQSVYRQFNYSANRVLSNAFPDEIQPWLHSRTAPQYWEAAEHRAAAIRWLVEVRLGLNSAELYRRAPVREDFAANGLSYMFNTYYNAVSRALAEAYPEKQPWELGKVPGDFWNDDTAASAIRWMVRQLGWQPEQLPQMVHNHRLNRKTFSEFGLATLFEKRFAKSIPRALTAAFPGLYQPWELGKVPGSYWQIPANVFHASRWVAAQEGFAETDIVPAIREAQLTWQQFSRYSIGAALKKHCRGDFIRIFAPQFWRERRQQMEERRLLKKIDLLKQSQRKTHLIDLLLYGLFYHQLNENAEQNIRRYNRLARRIQLRSTRFSDT